MKISRLSFVVLLIVFACSSEKETPKGYKYSVVKKGDGNTVKPGRFLLVDLYFKDAKDSIFYDNRKGSFLEKIVAVPDTSNIPFEEGFTEVFRVLSKGDSIVMATTAQVFYEKTVRQMVPPGMDPKGLLTFSIRVDDVLDTAQFEAARMDMATKEKEKQIQLSAVQLAKDTVIIDNYLKEKNLVAKKTKSGLRYIVSRQGKGPMVVQGQMVSVDYAGYLLSGKHFDTSIEKVAKAQNMYTEGRTYEPYTFAAGTRSVIDGWDEILMLMNKGTSVTVYIPSTLAYGSARAGADIAENSVLVFDMTLVNVQ